MEKDSAIFRSTKNRSGVPGIWAGTHQFIRCSFKFFLPIASHECIQHSEFNFTVLPSNMASQTMQSPEYMGFIHIYTLQCVTIIEKVQVTNIHHLLNYNLFRTLLQDIFLEFSGVSKKKQLECTTLLYMICVNIKGKKKVKTLLVIDLF